MHFINLLVSYTVVYLGCVSVSDGYMGQTTWLKVRMSTNGINRIVPRTQLFTRSATKNPDEAEEANKASKKTPLDAQPGAQPLSHTQRKMKNKLEKGSQANSKSKKASEKTPLSDISIGDKLKGTITGVKSYGIFVDIGAEVNGLVHVKDASKDYFVPDLEKRFRKKQELDVWVKFVDTEISKIGFQLFPVNDEDMPYESSVDVMQCKKGDPVAGRVKRVATHGLFVDVGNGVEAFLHRRKMKYPKNRFNMMPWEVHPVGSEISGFLLTKEEGRMRAEITTYAPEAWSRYQIFDGAGDGGDVDDDDDDEELGGVARSMNIRARRMALMEDEDEEEDDEDELDDSETFARLGTAFDEPGEDLSAAEIRKLLQGTKFENTQLLMDDSESAAEEQESGEDAENDNPNAPKKEKKKTGRTLEDEIAGEEMSAEEIYEEMCAGKDLPFITIKEVKAWPYLRLFFEEKLLNLGTLNQLMAEANPDEPGRLGPEHMECFVDLLSDSLGLDEGDDSKAASDGSSSRLDVETAQVEEIINDEDDAGIEMYLDDEDDSEMSSGRVSMGSDDISSQLLQIDLDEVEGDDEVQDLADLLATADDSNEDEQDRLKTSKSLDEIYSTKMSIKQRTNDLFQYVYESIAAGKGYVAYPDVAKWDFAQALIKQGAIAESEVEALFIKLSEQGKGRMDRDRFESFVDELSLADTLASGSNDSSNKAAESATESKVQGQPRLAESAAVSGDAELRDRSINIIPTMSSMKQPSESDEGRIDLVDDFYSEDLEDEDDDDFYAYEDDEEVVEMSVEEAWEDVSQGKASVSLEDVASWGAIADMIETGRISDEQFRALYEQASNGTGGKVGAKDAGMQSAGFERLLNLLIPFEDDEEDASAATEGLIREAEEPTAMIKSTDEQVIFEADAEEDIPQSGVSSNTVKGFEVVTNQQMAENMDNEQAEDVENTRKVFESLANGKAHCTMKDLLAWDFVTTLVGEGALSETLLQEKMDARGASKRGIGLEGFDRLVDDLVAMYELLESDYDAKAEETMRTVLAEGVQEGDEVLAMGQLSMSSDDLGDDSDEDVLEIDPAAEFDRIRGENKFVNAEMVKELSFVSQMLKDGVLTQSDFGEIFNAAGVEDAGRMDEDSFAAVLEILCERLMLSEFDDEK